MPPSSVSHYADNVMTSRLHTILLLIASAFSLTGCVDVDEYANSPKGNFEALWTIMDQHYCFVPEKEQQLGVNWNDVYRDYSSQANSKMTNSQLFEFLGNMLGTLKDGHVNLSSSFDFSRSWSWKEDYPTNFSHEVQRQYLGKSSDYRIASGMYYKILDDNIGYIYLGSFEDELGSGNIDNILSYLSVCNGLIIDIRSNGGGKLSEAKKLAARFTDRDVLVGYMRHKTGSGHIDLSDWEEIKIESAAGFRWNDKPVCLLTNRSVYSAANEFVKYMKAISNNNAKQGSRCIITTIGDTTGGGSGMPYSNELPNGWAVRLSACPMYDVNKVCTEFGIAPDVAVSMSAESIQQGIDDIIEAARQRMR